MLPLRPEGGLGIADPGDLPLRTSGMATGSWPLARLSRLVRLAFLMASLLALA